MPHRPELDATPHAAPGLTTTPGWQHALPILQGRRVVLREPRSSDASSLFAMLSTEDVARFINPPPSTIDGFGQFIAWTQRQRAGGASVSFAVTLPEYEDAVGVFQVRQVASSFEVAEWGFALGSAFWGTGAFVDAATLVLEFAFETLKIRRLEARAALPNGRGNGALLKIGAVQEGTLRRSFVRHGQHLDQALYAILEGDWRGVCPAGSERRHDPLH